ncbi:hypothetical protein J3R83DRAFT_9655 [Lanmaoa asiatica]|nr:hypothetical protein J3R83DRAFT_9655 [Lanmaoa asiatica]
MATMEPGTQHNYRGIRTNGHVEGGGPARRAHHGNKRWVADGVTGRGGTSTPHAGSDGERGGHRGGGRGRGRGGRGKFGNTSVTFRRNGALDGGAAGSEEEHSEMEEEHEVEEVDSNEPETPEERENFWQELVKAREVERKTAITEGKMDDPLKPKRLEDAITMVGTCMDMCPRFERYRRERENNLFEWETMPGTKRVDHKRAVKAYERAAGDKTLPSDLRPPDVLKGTLDYLFHELLPHGGFSETFNFIRDRSRAVRNDFTMQHEMGHIAIECHDRCARFHVLALHIERDRPGFSIAMEEQQLMNSKSISTQLMTCIMNVCIALQSLKEFYQDQRGHHQSPTELEMRVYHRLVHIRDQRERHDDIPQALLNHPVFELTTKFRARVQAKSAPITKTSLLVVDAEAMLIFAELADVLRREGNVVMTYLVACILERHFGKDTIEDIESIRGNLSLSDVIDGYSGMGSPEQDTDIDISAVDGTEDQAEARTHTPHESPKPLQPSGTQWLTDTFGSKPTQSAFFRPDTADPPSQPSVAPAQSVFSNLKAIPNAFGTASFGAQSSFTNMGSTASPVSVFGPIKDNNGLAPSLLPPRVTGVASVGFSTSSSVLSFPPFVPTPAGARPTIFTPQAEQSSQTAASFQPQPRQLDGSTLSAAEKSIFGSDTSTSKSLNPLAPTFTPTPNLASSTGACGLGTPTASVFDITPIVSVHSSTESCKSSSLAPILNEPSVSIPQQPTQEQLISDVPFVSSHPSVNSTSLECAMDQTPPPQPPPLNRRQPISLPPTPTATVFIPPSFSQARKSIFGSLKNIKTSAVSAAPTEILSPLVLHSPASRSLSSIPGLLRRESTQSPLKAVVSAADVEAEPEPSAVKLNTSLVAGPPSAEKPSFDIMKATALHFARRSWLVKQAFSKWRQRLSDQVRWIEACRRSTHYKEKAQAERLSRSVGGPPAPNGRTRRKTPSEPRAPLKKRLRDRLSGEYRPPANDEELARRFEKNHEDHARRWARGSFLGVLKDFLESTRKPLPDNWSAWLSLNQESDGTAIWLEQKFNVPDSGLWKNENVFHIPISKDHVELAHSYPGVVFFECTPLTGVTDILGRKYRVLEDCARLREIIEAFPADQHYVPSLLCITWSERDPDSSKDFHDMVESMLEELLHVVPFDLEGQLVKRVSLNDLFKIWEHEWEETTTRWLSNCIVYGEFNWDLYGKLLEGCTRLLVRIINSVTDILRDDGVPNDLPHLRLVKGTDSGTTFDAVLDWLQVLPETGFTASLMGDIRTHQNLGRDFPTMTFLSQQYALARSVAAHVADLHPEVTHFVSRSRLDDASKEIRRLKMSFEEEMKACQIAKLKPPKRLASFAETSSEQKQRLSDGSPTDEETTSPSLSSPLSTATSAPSEPVHHTIVTPAMLRCLTKDIRAKYGAQANALSVSLPVEFLLDCQCKTRQTCSESSHSPRRAAYYTMSASTSPSAGASSSQPRKPSVIITIGMAGAGKSTFVQRLNSHLHTVNASRPPYILNLDPAVAHVPFEPNIDIRDTVNYKEVMKQYNLGPNGGILTALNLFTTKFDQVLELVEKRAETVDYIILDTPGQIEIFTWSASGAIITDAVAFSFPTVVAYIIDTPRTTAPATFMSNMLYACSILYKTKLPFILVFNKTDVASHDFAIEWMQDFEAFQAALASHSGSRDAEGEPTYMNSLMNSMSLVLDEFYKHLKAVGVSSMTGDGMNAFFDAVEESRDTYEKEYLPELARARAAREKSLQDVKEASLSRFMSDLAVDRAKNPSAVLNDQWESEEENDDEEDLDVDIVDRSE